MKKKESSYVSMDLFQRCVPPFQEGLRAKEALASDDGSLTRAERTMLRKTVREGERAWFEVLENIEWVIDSAVKTELERPRSFHFLPDEDEMHQAGVEGAYKMMKNADLGKMKSAVNYLMQWVRTYVSRTALHEESQFGLPYSKLQKFRKIAAIRSRLADELGRTPTDEEVHDFVNSGKAHVRTMMGRAGSGSDLDAPRKADRIPLALIKEQREFSESGQLMKYPVTDDHKIDSMVSTGSVEDEVIVDSSKGFWNGWFASVHIDEHQWPRIAGVLGLYDVDDARSYNDRKSKRLSIEVQTLIGSKYGGIPKFASEWSESHGHGPWDVFIGVDDLSDITPDSIGEGGSRVFKELKFTLPDGPCDTPTHT